MATDEEKRLAGDIETLTEEMTNLELVSAAATGEQRDYYNRQLQELGDTKATKEKRLNALVAGRLGTWAVAVLLLLASCARLLPSMQQAEHKQEHAATRKEVRRG